MLLANHAPRANTKPLVADLLLHMTATIRFVSNVRLIFTVLAVKIEIKFHVVHLVQAHEAVMKRQTVAACLDITILKMMKVFFQTVQNVDLIIIVLTARNLRVPTIALHMARYQRTF